MAFSVIGLVIGLVALIPFVLVLIFRPADTPKNPKGHNLIFTIITYIGLLGCTVLLALSQDTLETVGIESNPWFWLSIVSFIGYVAVWTNYFFTGCKYENLFQAFGFIPMPITFFTILLYCFLSIYVQQLYMWISTIVLALGFVANTFYVYKSYFTPTPPNTNDKINQR